jgi:glycosyltransferase involved in cell wall biosynthesis
MRRLWDDPALCRRLGAAGHADVSARFNEDAHFGRLIATYEAALSAAQSARNLKLRNFASPGPAA